MGRSLEGIVNKIISECGTRNKSTRDQWLANRLSRIMPGSTILDAGAGELKYKKFCQHLVYRSQDFSSYNGKGTGEGLQTHGWNISDVDIISDITSIPEPNSSYDAVMCVEVFEHIPQPEKAMQEFSRLLKRNGILILTAPVCSLTHYAPYYFFNGFSKYYFQRTLPVYGFSIEQISYNGNFFEYVAQELRRITYMANRYSTAGFLDRFLLFFPLLMLIRLLNRFSKNDTGSYEMLSFGLHIVAIKQG